MTSWRRTLRPLLRTGQAGAAAAIAGAGALALVIATFVPFNEGGPRLASQTVFERFDRWEALEPIAAALAAAAAALLLVGRPFRLPAGILIALGLAEGLLALRYIGVPIVQPDEFRRSARAAPSCSGSARGPLAGVLARSWGERAVAWRE